MIFWTISALLLILGVLFVVIPLWRGSVQSNAVQRDTANIEIYRDQVSEMNNDLSNGLLTQEMYDQGKQELQVVFAAGYHQLQVKRKKHHSQ